MCSKSGQKEHLNIVGNVSIKSPKAAQNVEPVALPEWHSCGKWGLEVDRDWNSALLIQKIGLRATQGEDITSVKTALVLCP